MAGVVNLLTSTRPDGGEFEVFATAPIDGGGEQYNVSGAWGKRFDRGHLSIAADYYRQEMLRAGERDYLVCKNQYVFDPATGNRADRIDPRTGKPTCNDTLWGQVYVYGPGFTGRAGRFQYDYDGDLGKHIPTRPTDPAVSAMYPGAPSGFYLVNYDPASRGVVNASHPFAQKETIVPEIERATVFVEGSYELGNSVEVYGEFLMNRRESRTDSYRQFWNYTYTSTGMGYGGDPVTGFTGDYYLSATPITDHFSQGQRVDYLRGVLGIRGDLKLFDNTWKWDIFAQASRSDGDYSSDVILDDAIASTNFKTSSCVGSNLPVSGRPCIDMDFTDPRVLRGDLTDAERAFLFDRETGNTIYEQTYVEGSIGGSLFELPAGPLGLALGFHLRRDEILDTPGEITLANNSWGLSGAGITKGTEETSEVYAELAVPLLSDLPFIQNLDLSLSGRYTDTKTSGDATTYKVGLNWAMNDAVRIRATHGTSFRAPALFELYLADQESYIGQRNIDPCLNLDLRLAEGTITQQLFNNCRSSSGPGGGVAGDFTGGNATAEVVTGGGLGVLEPETSTSTVIGVIVTPPNSGLSVAVDYFEINIEDQVSNLGAAGILRACYLSDTFPTDPICNQFDRDPTLGITQVRDSFINIAEQDNRGIDFTVRYVKDLSWGTVTFDSQTTWTLENYTSTFAGNFDDPLGEVGYPELVGNLNLTVQRGPWVGFWGYDWIGEQDSFKEFVRKNGSPFLTIDGRQVEVKGKADFTGFHSLSLAYEADDWKLTGGVANLFDEKPPKASTVIGEYSTTGNSIFGSQYTEAFYGRRVFVRMSKSF